MNDIKTTTLERIGRIKQESVSSLWHEMLRQLSYPEREAWREAGFPSDPYAEETCRFCDLLNEDRRRFKRWANDAIAKAEQVAHDALRRAARPQAGVQFKNPENLKDLVELAKAMRNDVNIELPPPADVVVKIEKGAITNAPAPQRQWTVEADEGIDVSVDEEAGTITVRHEQAA